MNMTIAAQPLEPIRLTHPARFRIMLFLVSTSLIGTFQGIANILLPRAVEQFDQANKIGHIATLTTLAAILTVFGLIAGGALSDRTRSRWGKRTPTVAVSCILALMLMVALGSAQSILALMIFMPALWLALAFYQAAVGAMLPDRVPLAERGKAAAAFAMGTPFGLFIGVNIAEKMPSTFAAYLALGGLLLAGTLCLLLLTPEGPSLEPVDGKAAERNAASAGLFSAFRSLNYTLTFVSRALLFLSFFSVTGYLFYLVQDYIGVDRIPGRDASQAVSMLFSILTVAWLVATPLTGYIADRVKHTPFVVGISSIGIGLAILAPAISATWPAMLVFAIASGLAFGVYFAIDLKLMTLVLPDPDTAGRDLGILGIATAGPQIVTPAIAAGLIGLGGYATLFAVGALLAALGGVSALFIRINR